MFILLGIVIIILALFAINAVVLVADALAPYRDNGENTFRHVFIVIGLVLIPVLFCQAFLAAYQSF